MSAASRPLSISKPIGSPPPNLPDYEAARRTFSWTRFRRELPELAEGGLNIAHVVVDHHVEVGRRCDLALVWRPKKGTTRKITYGELAQQTNRFANVLASLDVQAGETMFSLAGRTPELYVGALGALKHRVVYCPLFSAFGPEPIMARMQAGNARVLLTTRRLYEKKMAGLRDEVPSLQHVLITDAHDVPEGTHSLPKLMESASDSYRIQHASQDDPALLHFTSGTTGKPKGALHVHGAVLAHHMTGRYALDLHPEDIYWCTADPGWVTGTSYGIVAPLSCGVTMFIDEAEFDARRWYENLQDQHVTVWYTAPTAIRMLIKSGAELPRDYDLSRLRFIASVGEPLNAEAVHWATQALDRPIHDTWWQTETGAIMVSNFASVDIKPGSMGRPVPGIQVAIVRRTEDGRVEVIEDPNVEGELAIEAGWPSMFREYLGAPERYASSFADGWYLSGDLARKDEDGYYWFVGRADDVIKSAGHLIGPFEVESALLEHPAVAEAAVIGKPDEVAGAIVKAFVSLRTGFEASDEVRKQLMAHARKRLGPAVAPREIEIRDDLPKTRSGKIMRRLLQARELGLPEGDTSTLEGKS